ncbi:hypothetical protein HNO88_003389 [Novosphingobium chloroacetimidivorans]|uniref:Uncharacterized protein n=1 Tax=Novosphingobium chloroacetimidivorans TaxID=1428314 RepID=A0A7W7KC42_9SPHN|nr:hypothetical protein [Novosphingobium chloroacetimidivorans]MBB4860051.1 hypothetical protein [Novosphingobium chloroacetimidivorans]
MIAQVPGFAALTRRLEAHAAALAQARVAAQRTSRAGRWRHAALLWPLFAKG